MHATARQIAVISAAFQFQWVSGNSQASSRDVCLIPLPLRPSKQQEKINAALHFAQFLLR
jgi:hypothetical protein